MLGEHRATHLAQDEATYSALCGEDKTMPGGKVAYGISRLYLNSLLIFRERSREEMAGRVVGSVRDMVTNASNAFVRVRAVGIEFQGAALLMPSPPEPGLPALAAALVARGGRLLGDEVVAIDPVLRQVHPLPFPLMLDTRDLALFPELGRAPARRRTKWPEGDARALVPRRLVKVEELGERAGGPVPIGWIVFPYFGATEGANLEPAGGAAALYRFIESGLNLHIWGDRAFTLFQEALEASPVSNLYLSDPFAAVDLLVETVPSMVGR